MDIFIILPTLASAFLASFLTHLFATKRSRKEFLLKKLEELLNKAQSLRQIEMELYELHLHHSLDRLGINNYFDMRANAIETCIRYNSPQNDIRSICQIYFPELLDSANAWINKTSRFLGFEQKYYDRISNDKNKSDLNSLINKTLSECEELEKVFYDELSKVIARHK